MKLKELRKQKNLKQGDVAKILNISQSAYYYYETGQREPNIDILIKLSKLFNVSVDTLIGRETDNEIDLSTLSNKKIELIKDITNIPDEMTSELHAYLKGMLYAEQHRQEIINKIRGNK